jgi:hypothetical protein
MASSGLLRYVALVRTGVSEELSASFIRVTRIGELGTTLAVTSNRRKLRRNTVRLLPHGVNIPEDAILHSHRRVNLKSYLYLMTFKQNFLLNILVLDFINLVPADDLSLSLDRIGRQFQHGLTNACYPFTLHHFRVPNYM